MARWATALAGLLVLAGCSQSGPGKAAIVDRCVAGGETAEICKCLAEQSAKKLDGEMFQIVVLGAQGEEEKTDAMVKALTPDRQTKFTTSMREIIKGCGAEGYLAAN